MTIDVEFQHPDGLVLPREVTSSCHRSRDHCKICSEGAVIFGNGIGCVAKTMTSVEQPISGFIIEATLDRPYLGFKLDLDSRELCEIIAIQTTAIADKKETSVRGFFVSTADVSLLDCALRLTRLLDTPQDIPILAPMMIREIYYRLLIGEQSEAVRQIATSGSNMQRIGENIAKLLPEPK